MRLRPIPASDYIYFDEKHRELLKEFGGVAVNDKLLPVWKNDYDIGLFFGGRGGGKSEVTCDKLLDDAMNSEYFKCYYGRKVFDTIRGSCFSTLIYCIKKNKLEEYFSYSEADNSSMIITCRLNSNKLIPFGSDKADKLKSIKDPTHIWCEEFDQFAFTDFKELYPTLRTIRGANIFIGTFNTHGVLPNHWILKVFFPDLYQGLDKEDVQHVDLMTGKRLKKVFVNFTDNYFIDQESYRQNLWLSSAGNTTIFEGLANGAWGVMVNESPWLFAFDRKKHVAKTELIATRRETLYLTFDFNRNPAACTVIQWPDQKKIQIIEVIKEPNIGTEGICEIILQKYPGFLYVVTGDYSGDTVSSLYKEQVTNYTVIKNVLKLNDGQIKISPNPRLEKNQTLVNTIFFTYPVEICPVKARAFIFDAENVKKRADGTIVKDNRDDPAQQADCFTGDTLIKTESGNKRMDEVNIGDLALTRNGYKKIIDKWDSVAEVWEFEFSNGTKIKCTKDHRFYNQDKGFLPIFVIFENKLNICQLKGELLLNQRQKETALSIMAGVITGIRIKIISILQIRKIIAVAFTGKCGLMLMVRYRKILMFIIKIGMHPITRCLTLNSKIKQNIKNIIHKNVLKKILNFLLKCKRKELPLLLNGINQRPVLNGIGKMQSTTILETGPMELSFANTVQNHSKQKVFILDFVQMLANLHGEERITPTKRKFPVKHAEKNLKHLNIFQINTAQKNADLHQTHAEVAVKKATFLGLQRVYDITVECEHEFYANNILVHNCLDTVRYFCNQFMGWYIKMLEGRSNDPKNDMTLQEYEAISIENKPDASQEKVKQLLHSSVLKNAIKAIEEGKMVVCIKSDYHSYVRKGILEYAGKCIDSKDGARAQIALSEIKRLDDMVK